VMAAEQHGAALRRLVDRQDIEQLARTYMRGLDRRDAVLLRSVFHDDATTHYGRFIGPPDDFVTMAMNSLSAHETNHHLIGQVDLWFEDSEPGTADAVADHATGEVYFQAFHRLLLAGQQTDLFISGRYVDRYERRHNQWGMTHRTEIVDWSRTEPTVDDYAPNRPELVLGRRNADDLSYHIADA
jgi:hypothetical protein